MARMPGAAWQPLATNWAAQPRMTAHDIICIHTMVGGLIGTDSYFRQGNGLGYAGTESHFGTGGYGEKVQWQDTAYQAEANLNGNWHVLSIENADMGPGFPAWNINDASQVPAFTQPQIEANAEILAWASSKEAHKDCPPSWLCHQVGIPLELIPDAKPGRRGIAYHRQGVPGYMVAGAEQWSTSNRKSCPGDRRIAQIPQIITRAKALLGGAPIEEDDMPQIISHVVQPGEEACIPIAPVQGGAVGWGPAWVTLLVDCFTDAPAPVAARVGIRGGDGAYRPWFPEGYEGHLLPAVPSNRPLQVKDNALVVSATGDYPVGVLIEYGPRV
jgi:hypothetical protein